MATRLAGSAADDVLDEALLAAWHQRSRFDTDRVCGTVPYATVLAVARSIYS